MKVSRAIEILQEKQQENEPHWERGDRDAIKLGIEALRAIKLVRENHKLGHIVCLAGETSDFQRGMTETMFINPETD